MKKVIVISGWAHGIEAIRPMGDALSEKLDVRLMTGNDVLKDQNIPDADFIITGSMGGLLAMELLPESCRKLVLISSTAKFCSADDYPHGIPERILKRMILQLKRNPDAVLEEFFKNVHYPHSQFFSTTKITEEHGGISSTNSVPSSAAGGKENLNDLVAGLEYLLNSDVRKTVPDIKIPVLLMHGSEDRIIPPGASEWLHEHLPQSQLTVFKNAGHALSAHNFADVITKTGAFLCN